MGGDGCTKATGRKYIRGAKVDKSTKSTDQRSEIRASRARDFQTCGISGKHLFKDQSDLGSKNSSSDQTGKKRPLDSINRQHGIIYACRMGTLYLKEELIRAKLNKTLQVRCPYAKSLKKDFLECHFHFPTNAHNHSPFVCPFTAIEADGAKRFCVIRETGLVISTRCFQEFKKKDLIPLIIAEYKQRYKGESEETQKKMKSTTEIETALTEGLTKDDYFYIGQEENFTPDENIKLNNSNSGVLVLAPAPQVRKRLLSKIMKEVREKKLKKKRKSLDKKGTKRKSIDSETTDGHDHKKEKSAVYASIFKKKKKDTAEDLLMSGNVRGIIRC